MMKMEEKESTSSGSPVNSGTESPSPVSQVVPEVTSMAVNMSMERNPSVGGGSLDSLAKKKRGRPRKYDADGNLGAFSPPGFSASSDFSATKRGRGRPPGSGNWQVLAQLGELFTNTAGADFTPHVVTVNTGEDVAGKIQSFSLKGPRGICVLSANGAVSNVTIRQPGSAGGILTYEGRFEILSLSGSYTISDFGGMRGRTGGLSVSLAGPDGRVIGGSVAGTLVAANPVQIVVGSFMPNGYKAHRKKHHRGPKVAEASPVTPNEVTEAKPISQSVPDGEGSLPTPMAALQAENNGGEDILEPKKEAESQNDTSSHSADSNGSEPVEDQRPSPDINVSASTE
ncbi:PPC domain [Dillenia turbinata]|uniref:AT-hook motif nuclear-localized protein n=1 Tax=Dillenia turbinata TaxID=194707 RepID=A0AAN8ZR22_9MAGN